MEKRNYKLYVHISPSNKRYYGITGREKVELRWQNGRGYIGNEYFTRAINKYGWANFQHIILFDNLTEQEANLLEKCYIALYDTTNPKYGYNQSLGGNIPNEEAKRKISEANKGENNHFYGKHHTEEAKRKVSEANKGKYNMNGKIKPILMFTKDEQFIRKFDSMADANEYLGKDRYNSNISQCARGKKPTAYGYKWIYEEDYIKEQEEQVI